MPYVGKRKQRALERKAQAQADAADGTATAGAAAAGAGAGPVAEAVLDAAAANGIANGKSAPPLPAPATAAAAIGTGGTGAAKHVPAAPPVPASAVAVNDSASAHMPQADPAEPAAVLPFCFTPICDAAEPATCRWSHTACAVGSKMYVFGGYGGQASHQRLNDLRVRRRAVFATFSCCCMFALALYCAALCFERAVRVGRSLRSLRCGAAGFALTLCCAVCASASDVSLMLRLCRSLIWPAGAHGRQALRQKAAALPG